MFNPDRCRYLHMYLMLLTQKCDFNLGSAPDEVKYSLGPDLACPSFRNLALNNAVFTQQLAFGIYSFDVLPLNRKHKWRR